MQHRQQNAHTGELTCTSFIMRNRGDLHIYQNGSRHLSRSLSLAA
jgi:hypothetical protein